MEISTYRRLNDTAEDQEHAHGDGALRHPRGKPARHAVSQCGDCQTQYIVRGSYHVPVADLVNISAVTRLAFARNRADGFAYEKIWVEEEW